MKRIKQIIREEVLKVVESLNNQYSNLYHTTTIFNFIKMLETNSIKSNFHRGFNKNDVQNGICFTRNKGYNVYCENDVLITFNPQKIAKITRDCSLIPYQDNEFHYKSEFEERLINNKKREFVLKLTECVEEVEIQIDVAVENLCGDIEYTERYIKKLKEALNKNILGNKLVFTICGREANFEECCNYLLEYCN